MYPGSSHIRLRNLCQTTEDLQGKLRKTPKGTENKKMHGENVERQEAAWFREQTKVKHFLMELEVNAFKQVTVYKCMTLNGKPKYRRNKIHQPSAVEVRTDREPK